MYAFPNLESVHCSISSSVTSWTTYTFLRRQVKWSGIPNSLRNFQFVVMHTVKGLCIVSEAEVDAFLEFSWFLYDLMTFGNLISSSFAFSKSSLYIWNFSIQVLLKPSLKDFEHYLASIWNEHNYVVVWTFFGIALLWIRMKTDLFQSRGHCWVFRICWRMIAAL